MIKKGVIDKDTPPLPDEGDDDVARKEARDGDVVKRAADAVKDVKNELRRG